MKRRGKPERRYFIYQLEADEQGDVLAKRRGVVRASNKIAKNDSIATGDSELTRFYQIQGGKIYEGMLMQENLTLESPWRLFYL